MKFFLANRKGSLIGLALLVQCSSLPPPPVPPPPPLSQPSLTKRSVPPKQPEQSTEALEIQESKDSHNPDLKHQLARRYWCSGRQGLAVENWLWIEHHHSHSSQAEKATNYLERARNHPESLRPALSCEQ